MAINKVVSSFDEAVSDVHDGAMIHIGGFSGPAESPSYLIAAIARKRPRDLTVVGNLGGWGVEGIAMLRDVMSGLLNIPDDFYDVGLLVEQGLVRKGILAFPAAPGTRQLPIEKKIASGEVEVELLGQGTIAERIRAARAGIPAFYTPTGVGTIASEGKEIREFDGRQYVMETALKADFAVIRALKADRRGNLYYQGTGRTFNATMAGAATVTIAEVDEVVELGEIEAEHVVTPGIYVERVVVRPKELKIWDQPC